MVKHKLSRKFNLKKGSSCSGLSCSWLLRRTKAVIGALLLMVVLVVIFQKNKVEISNLKVEQKVSSKFEKDVYNFQTFESLGQHPHDCKKITNVDAFNVEMTKHMTDFGKLECHNIHEISLKFNFNDTFTVSGYNIDSVISKEIIKDKEGFTLGDKYHLKQASLNPNVERGTSAGLRNQASSRCIVPEKYNEKTPPDEIFLIFSEACNDVNSVFTFTKEGYFRHNVTGKCFGPKGGVAKNDVPLVLMNKCNETFTAINDGVLQHSSKLCVHPLWGGNQPAEGQKLCFWDSCKKESRLQFKNYVVLASHSDKKVVQTMEVKKELNMVEIMTGDQKTFTTFVSSAQKKPLKHLEGGKAGAPNIYVITLDEVSGAHFKRKLPKSQAYLYEKMKAVEYEYYASVTDSARENVYVMTNGMHPADNFTPASIFSLSRKHAYASLFVADFPYAGFESVDSDHNGVPMYQAMKKFYDAVALKYCLITQPMYEVTFNYFRSFINSYKESSKLGMMVLTEMTQQNYNKIGYIDEVLEAFLRQLHGEKNTVVIMNSIKGSLAGKLSQVPQGVKEYRRPLLQIHVSDDLKGKFKLDNNRKDQLSSPYDLYVSISEFISNNKVENKYGKSFTENIPPKDCLSCGVTKSMCPC